MSLPDNTPHVFRTQLSLLPLLDFWREQIVPRCPHMAEMFKVFEQQIMQDDALNGHIRDMGAIEKNMALIGPLMWAAFPPAAWETAIAGAVSPLEQLPFFCTPNFKHILIGDDGRLKGRFKQPDVDYEQFKRQRAFWLILDKIYGIGQGRSTPVVRIVTDSETGLDRYYRILADWQFLKVEAIGTPKRLGPEERLQVLDHIDDPDMLAQLIPPQQFMFRGFTIIHAVDVTESEVVLALQRDLISHETMFCTKGFNRLQDRLQTLFGRPNLHAGMGALQGDQVWVVREEEDGCTNCIFKNSNHIPISELEGSIWLRAVEKGDMLIVADLAEEAVLCAAEQDLLDSGTRAVLIVPLYYQGDIIGTFFVKSPTPGDFTAMDKIMIKPLVPMFSMALKRGVDDINNEVQAIIKEKCTALHPSVEWRFRKAAFSQLERLQTSETAEMEPIVFNNVIPLYGQTDIRGSAEARSACIQADLIEQLNLAYDVMHQAAQVKPWPLVLELQHRIQERVAGISQSIQTGAEAETGSFLSREVAPAFEALAGLGPRVSQAIEKYRLALDPRRGFIYRKRKAYESSVSMLNERLSAFLDQEEAEAQKAFPHYFEKHQTDGVDYMIYLGAALREDGHFNPFHLQNLVLWQLVLACGMAWHTEQIKPNLSVALDTCHLIFYNPAPLSIRFRYDEKRFDVDGAYDVRHEIIKSRLDKAMIKNGGERLTQPGRIAIVYSQPQELRDMRKHVNYLQARGYLLDDIEIVDLDDLPNVSGLKALRVGVNLEHRPMAQQPPASREATG
jgi:hypothetical protein